MNVRKGSVVSTPNGQGVVWDQYSYADESLVRMDSGTALDMSHGRWFPNSDLVPTGEFRPNALVWFAGRVVKASETIF